MTNPYQEDKMEKQTAKDKLQIAAEHLTKAAQLYRELSGSEWAEFDPTVNVLRMAGMVDSLARDGRCISIIASVELGQGER